MSRSPLALLRKDLGFLHFTEAGYESEFNEAISRLENTWKVYRRKVYPGQLSDQLGSFYHEIGAENTTSLAIVTELVQNLVEKSDGMLVSTELRAHVTWLELSSELEIFQSCYLACISMNKPFKAVYMVSH